MGKDYGVIYIKLIIFILCIFTFFVLFYLEEDTFDWDCLDNIAEEYCNEKDLSYEEEKNIFSSPFIFKCMGDRQEIKFHYTKEEYKEKCVIKKGIF